MNPFESNGGTRTVADLARLSDGTLDVHGRFFGFGGDVAACRCDERDVGLAVRVAEVEAAEVDNGGGGDLLAEGKPSTELLND